MLWSPDGGAPWRPWPPLGWSEKALLPRDQATTVTTPLRETGPWGDYVFISVRMPGYYDPRPQLAPLYILKTTRLRFDLQETPEHFAACQRAAGLVPYRGEWVNPQERGLEEFEGEWMLPDEALARRMKAKGYHQLDGRWLAPAEYEAAFSAQQRSRGLVPFKGRWMGPGDAARERLVDEAVASLEAMRPGELQPPKVLGRVEKRTSLAGLSLINPGVAPVRWLISGPSSQWLDLAPGQVVLAPELQLLPGRYTIVVFSLDPKEKLAPGTLLPPDLIKAAALAATLRAGGDSADFASDDSSSDSGLAANENGGTGASAAMSREILLLSSQPFSPAFEYRLIFSGLPPNPAP